MSETTELDLASCCTHGELEWYGCYGSGAKYNKYTIPESVTHPAKMSWELLERIFKHLESMNLLTPDSVVIDFMSGTGRTNTMAALNRYRTISVELEPHFIEMIAGYDCDGISISEFKIKPCVCKSDTLHKPHKIKTGLFEVECSGNPTIIPVCRCGDKHPHKKHHVLGNKELLERITGRKVKWDVIRPDARELVKLMNLTDMVGVISPPYFSQVAFQDKDFIISIAEDKSQRVRDGRMGGHFATPEAIRRSAEKIMEIYSLDPRNIGNLPDKPLAAIVSPPYCEAQTGGGIAIQGYRGPHIHEMGKNQPDKVGERCGYKKDMQGASEGQIGNFPDNNKGVQQGSSYLSAMLEVYQQAYLCGISPLVVVVKNPTRNGKLRRLDIDTVRLLQLSGYEIFDYKRAILFESHKQETLEGGTKNVHKGRISFFKRLSLEKGTTVATWEDVIFARIL